jgi:hypothetical protein
MHPRPSGSPHRPAPSFCAVIGHADDPDLLERCIAHHLAIGVGHVFVSLNTADADSERAARSFAGDARVRAARVETFAPDPFHYFTAALHVARDWAAPDWVLFVDSDEFWVPASGYIAGTPELDAFDMLAVPRFNAPPVREADGSLRALHRADPARAFVVNAGEITDPRELERDPALSWVMAKDHPKLLVRPEFVVEVGRGAHTIVPTGAAMRGGLASDLLIVHVPFTTRERFGRKIGAIRKRMADVGDRFGTGQAWHWRRWLELDAAGEIDAEFDRQVVDVAQLETLHRQGVLTTPAEVFARERACA